MFHLWPTLLYFSSVAFVIFLLVSIATFISHEIKKKQPQSSGLIRKNQKILISLTVLLVVIQMAGLICRSVYNGMSLGYNLRADKENPIEIDTYYVAAQVFSMLEIFIVECYYICDHVLSVL